jgi:hypothetical protein
LEPSFMNFMAKTKQGTTATALSLSPSSSSATTSLQDQLTATLSLSSHVFLPPPPPTPALPLFYLLCRLRPAEVVVPRKTHTGRACLVRRWRGVVEINSASLLRLHAVFGYLALYLAVARCTPGHFISFPFFFFQTKDLEMGLSTKTKTLCVRRLRVRRAYDSGSNG